MTDDDKKNKLIDIKALDALKDEEGSGDAGSSGTEGGGSRGGAAGTIEFHYQDILSTPSRDDNLPPNEIKRLAVVQKEIHKGLVTKQKILIEQRAALKAGEKPKVQQGQAGYGFGGGGSASRYKEHPVSRKAQFSGIDKQMIGIANANESQTNTDRQNELQARLQNRYQNVPRFNPRPQFPG